MAAGTVAVRRLARVARAQPVTIGYVLALLTTTVVLHHVSARLAAHILAASSTDVAHLDRDPVRVLVESALWIPGGHWLPYAVVLLLALAPLERRFGATTAVLVFVSGHVLATLITEVPVGIAVAAHWMPPTAAHRLDVGVSYGMFAAVGACAVLLSRRSRAAVLAVALAVIVVPAAADPDMTMYGHLASLLIGVCWWPLLRRRSAVSGSDPARQLSEAGVVADAAEPARR